jgi:sodium/hydrogen exchanger-like protein 6/7
MLSFPRHHFDALFIVAGFLCTLIGRAVNVYPLAWILNLGRKPKMPWNFQHMLFFAGLRGAMSFALAIRNTVSDARQIMLTCTSLIVITTVIFQGGSANYILNWLKIPVGAEDENEQLTYQSVKSVSVNYSRMKLQSLFSFQNNTNIQHCSCVFLKIN